MSKNVDKEKELYLMEQAIQHTRDLWLECNCLKGNDRKRLLRQWCFGSMDQLEAYQLKEKKRYEERKKRWGFNSGK